MPDTPPPPDIARDKIFIIWGGTIVPQQDALATPTQNPYVWVTLCPAELDEREKARTPEGKPAVWPRERHARVMCDTAVGTVDELVTDFREKLTRAFNAIACKNADGGFDVIPTFGEASLRKQNEVLDKIPRFNSNLPVIVGGEGWLGVQEREKVRVEMMGFTPAQDALKRDRLARLLAQYDNESPSLSVHRIKGLMADLAVLLKDQERAEGQLASGKPG